MAAAGRAHHTSSSLFGILRIPGRVHYVLPIQHLCVQAVLIKKCYHEGKAAAAADLNCGLCYYVRTGSASIAVHVRVVHTASLVRFYAIVVIRKWYIWQKVKMLLRNVRHL